MTAPLRILSSMATKELLAGLTARFDGLGAQKAQAESIGGVDVLKRVEAGEEVDVVVLAANAIDKLIDQRRLLAGSRVDLVRSGIAIAVKAGAPVPDVSSEEAVKQAVLAARTVGFSTGPSGVYIGQLFERWGITQQLGDRVVCASPGVPVGQLIAEGKVELGFQQLSELMHIGGITVLGPLPPAIQQLTTFSAGISATSAQPEAVKALLAFMSSPAVDDIKRANGMEPFSS
jgi:molybdate transport system substrate-binding protein